MPETTTSTTTTSTTSTTTTPVVFDICVSNYLNDPAQVLLCSNIVEAAPSKRTTTPIPLYPCKSTTTGQITNIAMKRIVIYPKVRTYNNDDQPNATEAWVPAVTVCEEINRPSV